MGDSKAFAVSNGEKLTDRPIFHHYAYVNMDHSTATEKMNQILTPQYVGATKAIQMASITAARFEMRTC